MKLIRFEQGGKVKPGIISPDGRWLDVSAFGEDYNEDFFTNDGLTRLGEWLAQPAQAIVRWVRQHLPLSSF